MSRHSLRLRALCVTSALTLAAVHSAQAQSTPPAAPPTKGETNPEETVVLSPFVVTAEEDEGYQATSTLAGTRVRTDLKDVASATSVITKQFLVDTGVTKQEDLLVYTTNTEVGGLLGNFSGLGNGSALSERASLLRPSSNNRVRGLDAADNTRDYFQTFIPWDSYIVDRVDMQRGPNSILFGVGSPAGLVNSSINTATFKTGGKIENRIASFGSQRNSLDYNHVLVKNTLSFRISALDDDQSFRQKPAFNHDKRFFSAMRWDPKLIEGGQTSLRVNFENGGVTANRPRQLPPIDKITDYFGGLNRQSFDMYDAWRTIVPQNSTSPASSWNPYVDFYMARLGSANPVYWYNQSNAAFRTAQSNPSTLFGVNGSGAIDAAIDGFTFARPIGIAGYNQYAKAMNLIDPTKFLGAEKNFYKDKTLSDDSVFDFYNLLLDGDNKREWQDWRAYNIALSQTFFNNKLGFEFVYDHQDYSDGQRGITLGDNPFISVDINSHLVDYPKAYGSIAVANPNVGAAYIGGSAHYGNQHRRIIQDSYRLTATGDVRVDDYLKNAVGRFLGRQVFTGLYSKDTTKRDNRSFLAYGTDTSWASVQGLSQSISDGARQVDWIYYLSDSLKNKTTASGLHIGNIAQTLNPTTATVRYFDSHWNSSVNPGATWTNPVTGAVSTQSENPANYVGYTTRSVKILSAEAGDINDLYTDATKQENVIKSTALTWQGQLWDGNLVPTFGWRKDKVNLRSASAPINATTKVASMAYDITGAGDDLETTSKSWGAVLHIPSKWTQGLPGNTTFSLSYFHGTNGTPEVRYGFDGGRLPIARGETDDMGVVINTLNDKITLKINKYKTKVYDGNLSGDPSSSTLGANTYYIYLLESWGVGSAVTNALGLQGQVPGWEWYWNWAMVDDNGWGNTAYTDNPATNTFLQNHPSTVKEKAAIANWIATMPSQSFFDAYGMPVNVAKLKAGDYAGGLPGWSAYNGVGSIQAAGAGKINGLSPVGTIDSESAGYELELTARPTKNWNITMNASKTTAKRTRLSAALSSMIENTHKRFQGAAGDLRLWWGGDNTIRQYYDNNIYSAYQFQLESDGARAPELRPWRYNMITNYNFDRGMFKGVNAGLSYRWEDAQILGYGITTTTTTVSGVTTKNTKLDVTKPISGKSETSLDGWVGYGRKLSKKVDWRIQLNLRNIGEDPHLVTVSVQPDGTPAARRIAEGMTWQLTNSLSF